MAYLELTNVAKYFNNTPAVRDFNLAIEKGQLVSFLGPSGCGKTTTLRMIAGFETPDQGMITLEGEDISKIPPNKRNIGMVFQSYALFPNMTILDNVCFGLKMHKVEKSRIKPKAMEVLDLVRLADTANRYPNQLSGGQQQRIALARALAIEPRVLLLDEPLSALDAEVRVALRGEIRRIQTSLKITTVYVTHDQEEALSISDRVVVMDKSHIEQVGTPQEIYLKPNTKFVATFIGTANEFKGKNTADGTILFEDMVIYSDEAGNYPAGSDVVALVRPEKVRVHMTKPEGLTQNLFEGVVETITFHGSSTRLGIRVGSKLMTADVAGKEIYSYDQKVWVSFQSDACQVLQ